jgi:ankyrin repeat protein
VDDRVAGVAYCRLFSDGDHGHGYVDDCTPEVAVAACRNHRGRGLGEAVLLHKHPDGLNARTRPYEHTLLHLAAQYGQLAAVELLMRLGLDVDVRERGDNTYPMHWAAAGGHLDVVRLLEESGGDVVVTVTTTSCRSSVARPAGKTATTPRIRLLRTSWSVAAHGTTSSPPSR